MRRAKNRLFPGDLKHIIHTYLLNQRHHLWQEVFFLGQKSTENVLFSRGLHDHPVQ